MLELKAHQIIHDNLLHLSTQSSVTWRNYPEQQEKSVQYAINFISTLYKRSLEKLYNCFPSPTLSSEWCVTLYGVWLIIIATLSLSFNKVNCFTITKDKYCHDTRCLEWIFLRFTVGNKVSQTLNLSKYIEILIFIYLTVLFLAYEWWIDVW